MNVNLSYHGRWSSSEQSWSSGRISACFHAGDPGSIPGDCTLFLLSNMLSIILFFSFFFFFKKNALRFLCGLGFILIYFIFHAFLLLIALHSLKNKLDQYFSGNFSCFF